MGDVTGSGTIGNATTDGGFLLNWRGGEITDATLNGTTNGYGRVENANGTITNATVGNHCLPR